MATHSAIPGANLPESSSSIGKGRTQSDAGTTGSTGVDVTRELPGETGLGSGLGSSTGGFGTGDVLGDSASTGARTFPRAAGVMDQVKQQASTRVNEQKARAAEGLGSVASAIRQASEQLRSENKTLAEYSDKAVDQIQLFADRIRDKEPAEMLRDLERFARRNPAAFVGSAFLLGLGLARFLKSTNSEDRSVTHRDSDFGGVGMPRGGASGTDFSRPDDFTGNPGGLSTGSMPGVTR